MGTWEIEACIHTEASIASIHAPCPLPKPTPRSVSLKRKTKPVVCETSPKTARPFLSCKTKPGPTRTRPMMSSWGTGQLLGTGIDESAHPVPDPVHFGSGRKMRQNQQQEDDADVYEAMTQDFD